jgi:transcriptional regulator GlxA family with amidase domain
VDLVVALLLEDLALTQEKGMHKAEITELVVLPQHLVQAVAEQQAQINLVAPVQQAAFHSFMKAQQLLDQRLAQAIQWLEPHLQQRLEL